VGIDLFYGIKKEKMKREISIIILILFFQIGYSQNLIPFRDGDKWGYANSKGEIVIKPKYQEAGEFRNKITWVKKNDKYGYINKKGRKKTCFKFDNANYFGFGTATVQKGDKKYCINLKGRKAKCRYGCGGAITIMKGFQTYKKGEKIGMLKYGIAKNEEGKSIEKIDSLPPIWDNFRENQKGYAAVKKDSLWGIINGIGELIVDYQYELIEVHSTAYKRNKFFKIKKNNKYGFLNEEGELVVEPKYHKAEFYTQSKIAKVWIDDVFWGYIDETGKEFFR